MYSLSELLVLSLKSTCQQHDKAAKYKPNLTSYSANRQTPKFILYTVLTNIFCYHFNQPSQRAAMTHEVSGFDWHPESLWLRTRPTPLMAQILWLQIISTLGLSLSPHLSSGRSCDLEWGMATNLFDNYKWHTCSPLSCYSGTLSGPLRSFNLQIYVMMVNSSVDWSHKEPLCPTLTTPAWCNLPFHIWDHWDYWTGEPLRIYDYSKWVEGEAVTQIFFLVIMHFEWV